MEKSTSHRYLEFFRLPQAADSSMRRVLTIDQIDLVSQAVASNLEAFVRHKINLYSRCAIDWRDPHSSGDFSLYGCSLPLHKSERVASFHPDHVGNALLSTYRFTVSENHRQFRPSQIIRSNNKYAENADLERQASGDIAGKSWLEILKDSFEKDTLPAFLEFCQHSHPSLHASVLEATAQHGNEASRKPKNNASMSL